MSDFIPTKDWLRALECVDGGAAAWGAKVALRRFGYLDSDSPTAAQLRAAALACMHRRLSEAAGSYIPPMDPSTNDDPPA